jgi:hypothetical protein
MPYQPERSPEFQDQDATIETALRKCVSLKAPVIHAGDEKRDSGLSRLETSGIQRTSGV